MLLREIRLFFLIASMNAKYSNFFAFFHDLC